MGKVKELLMEMEVHGYEILTKGEKYIGILRNKMLWKF